MHLQLLQNNSPATDTYIDFSGAFTLKYNLNAHERVSFKGDFSYDHYDQCVVKKKPFGDRCESHVKH